MFYIHPWEYDPEHPKVDMDWKAKLTHYQNLKKTVPNTQKLLKEFEFDTVSNIVKSRLKERVLNSYSINDFR